MKKNEHAIALSSLGAAKGGLARAARMTSEERSEAAKRAAQARWDLPVVTHEGTIQIGTVSLPCANLDNGKRVLMANGLAMAFGSSKKSPDTRSPDGSAHLPAFLAYGAVYKHVSDELTSSLRSPPKVRTLANNVAYAYDAEWLPIICEAIITAERAGDLKPGTKLALAARTLYSGLARVGVIALVDEATGYQADRARDALAKILEKFIAKELRPWVRTFQPDFYQNMFRLRGWDWKGMAVNRPQAAAGYTKDLVYARLAPGVLEELKKIHEARKKDKKPKAALHQSLTDDFGHPKLREHLAGVTALMKASGSWESFIDMVDRVYPKYGETLKLLPPDPSPSGR